MIYVWKAWLEAKSYERTGRVRDETGATALEWALISAAVLAIAAVVYAAVDGKVTELIGKI